MFSWLSSSRLNDPWPSKIWLLRSRSELGLASDGISCVYLVVIVVVTAIFYFRLISNYSLGSYYDETEVLSDRVLSLERRIGGGRTMEAKLDD